MSRNKTMERFFDEADFTTTHDEIFEHLINHWTDYVRPIMKCGDVTPNIVNARIDGEPALNGYPPLFPDAIAYGKLEYDHTYAPVKLITKSDRGYDNYIHIYAECGVTGCNHTQVQEEFGSCSHDASDSEKTIWNKRVTELEEEWQQKPRYWKSPCNGGTLRVIFEIKPNKESAGRILRQINFYKERLKESRLDFTIQLAILITPDSSFDQLFKSQGVIPVRPLNHANNIDCKRLEEY